ncbi:Peroxiredoxin [Thiohalospira halophila DSM 15071]|uniref:Peroxiredoxin n=1 Tax=Thiohalospira halophila DSM 15071 TaxID=1123397 RepID=A0A1I1Q4P7_9GAMM|nr:TlpA disulfide reductase family protein [Thiohalospira halophila]SFD14193.1 Peroxiredoxin [Thiohalospira halophila DSM 15071]
MSRRPALIVILLALLALAGGGYYLVAGPGGDDSKASAKGEPRPAFTLPDLDGKERSISEWDGQVVLLNFWASWCPPCRREIPAFVDVQEDYRDQGLRIIGVAIDDRQAVVDFTNPMGVNYPILLGGDEGIGIAEAYGNRMGVLPYTVLIDREGRIVERWREELSYEDVEKAIEPLL